jgi:formamidopyrimidine-DNA glycosylase
MPELPDVEAYIAALQPRIVGGTLQKVRLNNPFLLRTVKPPIRAAEGRRVTGLCRVGKRIAVGFEDGLWIVLHLMIAGRLHWKASGAALAGRRDLAAFDFADGTLLLTEAGTKRRAALHVVEGEAALAALDPGGIEPLACDRAAFAAALTQGNHTVKRALTDPKRISGIGNAYSDEILHAARLSPVTRCRALDDATMDRLFQAAGETLTLWRDRLCVEARERFPEKVTAFRKGMAVHGRYGEPCPVCGTKVQRIRYTDNETNYCPRCQTDGRILADRSLSRLLNGDWPKTIEELEGL